MLIKAADDKQKRLQLLESLMTAPVLTAEQRKFASNEFWNLQQGIRGERDAAHYLDNHFAADANLAVIHDLRLVVDGEVAQIDHLLITRGFVFYLLETKHFNGNLAINEYGEFSVAYGTGKTLGIPSPLEQSRRHKNVLLKLLDKLGIVGRTQKVPDFRHVVLVNPKATIDRPDAAKFDSSNVIKADQFASWREKYVNTEVGLLQTFGSMFNLRTADTVKAWAQQLCAEHRAVDQLALPEQLKPMASYSAAPIVQAVATAKVASCAQCGIPVTDAEQKFCISKAAWFDGKILCRAHQEKPMALRSAAPVVQAVPVVKAAFCAQCGSAVTDAEQKFCTSKATWFDGKILCRTHQESHRKAPVKLGKASAPSTAHDKEALKRKLICCTCGDKITFPEGKFCWANEQRFKGFQYCREHQAEMLHS